MSEKSNAQSTEWRSTERLRGKREKIALNVLMRKSLVTFGSVESQWDDKGRSQIAGRRDGVGEGEVRKCTLLSRL